ncbi:MAG: type II toxin-antitoxin system RelE/ParE family toxin [Lentihominibacter sp.]
MKYEVVYTDKAIKTLQKLDRAVLVMIKAWIDKNLVGTKDPRQHGKALTGDKKGLWRYRVGDYRLLADIQDDKVVIVIVAIGHRRAISSIP